jgi:hypothetical protein
MNQRNKGKGRNQPQRHRGRPGPRKPPPAATGAEETFVQELIDGETEVAVELRDGTEVKGTIVGNEQELLWLNDAEGHKITLRKAEIRHLQART